MPSKLISILVTSLLLVSCADEQLATPEVAEKPMVHNEPSNDPVAIKVNQSIKFDDLTIEFMQLAGDSRCPKGVQCAWAGNAQVVLLVSDSKTAQTVSLNTHGGERYPKKANFGNKQLELISVKPYPATNIKIEPSQIQALIEVSEYKSLQEPVIIDVRTAEEYAAGHFPGAINLNYETIGESIASLSLAKDSEIIVYCRSGRRSGVAKDTLESLGFSQVTNGINQDTLHQMQGSSPVK